MIGLVLLFAAILAVVGGILALRLALDTRSAADPDKETPPAGWDPRTADTAVIERKPDSICARCCRPISDGETVWMQPATGSVFHIRCAEMRRTLRA